MYMEIREGGIFLEMYSFYNSKILIGKLFKISCPNPVINLSSNVWKYKVGKGNKKKFCYIQDLINYKKKSIKSYVMRNKIFSSKHF